MEFSNRPSFTGSGAVHFQVTHRCEQDGSTLLYRLSRWKLWAQINKMEIYEGMYWKPYFFSSTAEAHFGPSSFAEPVSSCTDNKIDVHEYRCLVRACFEAPGAILIVELLCTTRIKQCLRGKFWSGGSCSTPRQFGNG